MSTAVRVASSLRGRRLLTLVSKVLIPTAPRRRMAQDTDRASVATTVREGNYEDNQSEVETLREDTRPVQAQVLDREDQAWDAPDCPWCGMFQRWRLCCSSKRHISHSRPRTAPRSRGVKPELLDPDDRA
ncbi:hypothetical protein ARMSODRAFT_1078516 [Armillaria solidipes]|uniref:Uncharacterized protein n=1 Tax=Armillaria solidipes TaxID=1076256 RepID=A0A2H3CJR4_9AGAR|nr:hypothetical protein ARMSODRAFT_1078516 [Armillaria solidipes]